MILSHNTCPHASRCAGGHPPALGVSRCEACPRLVKVHEAPAEMGASWALGMAHAGVPFCGGPLDAVESEGGHAD